MPLYQIVLFTILPHPHYPILWINTSLLSSGQTLYQAGLIFHCCSALLQNVVGNSGKTQCFEEAEQHADTSVDVPPPLQIVISFSFCLFSLYLYPLSAPFHNSLFSLSSFPLAVSFAKKNKLFPCCINRIQRTGSVINNNNQCFNSFKMAGFCI